MFKEIIDNIFNKVSYWNEKKLLLEAIPLEYYNNKEIVLRLLKLPYGSVSPQNEAKREMWNHQVETELMGDDIIQKIDKRLLKDIDFVKLLIKKYNRSYIFLEDRIKDNKMIALLSSQYEIRRTDNLNSNIKPILAYMSKENRDSLEIAGTAIMKNIRNIKYSKFLQDNKYFVADLFNKIDHHDTKSFLINNINKNLLIDKKFVARLGCFDNLCKTFKGDLEYLSEAVVYDLNILKKVEHFDEKIVKNAMLNKNVSHEDKIITIFKYIERFNDDEYDLISKIKDKELLNKLLWEMGTILSYDY